MNVRVLKSISIASLTRLQQGLELVPADPQEVPGAGVEAGAESGGDGGEPAAERGSPSRWRGPGVEEGGNSAVSLGVFPNVRPHRLGVNQSQSVIAALL